MLKNRLFLLLAALLAVSPASSCTSQAELQGTVKIDGSSTVFPITEAVAEEFRNEAPRVRVTVGISGTGGGMKKFTVKETDISDASRPIKQKEFDQAQANGVQFVELPVAYDGLSVVVNRENTWVDQLTVEELNKIWDTGSTITNWKDVRPGFPDVPMPLYGPGVDSGTFDYFTEAVNGESQRCRSDFTASEDDNVLVQGVAGDTGALGFFGYAYYVENTDKLRVVPIVNGQGDAVAPSEETINNGTYEPLSRPLFIYVNVASAERPEVERFVQFYLDNAATLAAQVGYVGLPAKAYELAKQRFAQRVTGTVFGGGGATVGVTIEDLLAKGL